ncbi:MAG: cytochrome P450 [Candidatus Microthrix sp.]|uniref:Cytochrome P450 n=1 Tax=Candidatus Neomicrothrix subdominans TaxID=2954438 RepID=A0A936TDL9_9ACTN|nr:cytochrome P450 [Candidatus Microthrix sp.]MBK9296187.1 cytochrome P450 [Candidatus Microthrix subdominans]MBK6968516.1 cytochrome P450 [Candidatus Microthrix sp.]MBK7164781.1 cytochrome P450 [Candidatus Microthrix sp.]MBP7594879.1 cytochrome P450 [Candidatus Microthrix sp.]
MGTAVDVQRRWDRQAQPADVVAYLAGRDERSWPDAERFDPDRFEDPTDHQRGLARQAWVPFGRGPHMWFGFALAQMELSIVLSRLVQALDITIVARTMPRPVGTWSIARPAASSCGDDVRFGAVDGRSNRWLNRCGTGRQPAEPRVAGGVSGAGYRPSGRGDEVPARTSMPDLVSPATERPQDRTTTPRVVRSLDRPLRSGWTSQSGPTGPRWQSRWFPSSSRPVRARS